MTKCIQRVLFFTSFELESRETMKNAHFWLDNVYKRVTTLLVHSYVIVNMELL